MSRNEVEILQPTPPDQGSAVSVLARAEIDSQVSTAKAYPRTLSRVKASIMDMATLDEDFASDCIYALKRGNKTIQGPSIRFAEIIKQAFGNCRAATRVVNIDRAQGFIEAEGIFHDLESNSVTVKRTMRRITDNEGRVYSADMIIVTGNAACSVALRNAILDGVPRPLWSAAYETIQHLIGGDIQSLSTKRAEAIRAFAIWGITEAQVLGYISKPSIEDITNEDVVILWGTHSAIKNGEETVDAVFSQTSRDKARNDRANPFAGVGEKPVNGAIANKAERSDDALATDGTDEKPRLFQTDAQPFSDWLWKSKRTPLDLKADADAYKAKHTVGRSADEATRSLFVKVQEIHSTRVASKDPDKADNNARLALAELGIESPETA